MWHWYTIVFLCRLHAVDFLWTVKYMIWKTNAINLVPVTFQKMYQNIHQITVPYYLLGESVHNSCQFLLFVDILYQEAI